VRRKNRLAASPHWRTPKLDRQSAPVGQLRCQIQRRSGALRSQLEERNARAAAEGQRRVVLCQEDAVASCCARDEGGPFGAVLQGEVSNRHKVLRTKAVVLNVVVKRHD
jgi:hypothetical protein